MTKKTESAGVTEEAAPAVVAEAPAPTASDRIVDEWFVEQFHNRGHTVEEYNRVREAAAALKARLNAVPR